MKIKYEVKDTTISIYAPTGTTVTEASEFTKELSTYFNLDKFHLDWHFSDEQQF